MSRRPGSALNSRVRSRPSTSGSWMSISTRRGRTERMLALAVSASQAVCTSYPFFSRSQRSNFKLASLSSTIRIGSPAIAAPFSLRCLPSRKEGIQLPEQRGGAAALGHHGMRRLAQARMIVGGEVLDGPHDHGRAAARLHPAEPLEKLDSVDARHDHVEDDREG